MHNQYRYKIPEIIQDICGNKYDHWRVGQLLSNFIDWLNSEKLMDIFYCEDEELYNYLIEFSKEGNI